MRACRNPRQQSRLLARSVVAFALLFAPIGSRAAEALRIGLAAPLSGPDAGYGQGLRAGAEQAVAEINRAGGVDGRKIALTVLDDAGEAKKGVAVARQLAGAGIALVIGPINSGVAAAALPVYEEAGILVISPGTTYPGLTRRDAWNLFRLSGNDAQQGRIAGATLAERFRDRPVAILNDKTAFGRTLADEAARALKAGGGREALFEGIGRGDKDFAPLVARMKAAGVVAVYFGGLATEAGLLVRAMHEAELAAPLLGSDGLLDKDFPQIAGPGAEGTLMTLSPDPRRPPELKGGTRAPRPPEAEMFSGLGYAAVELLKQGVESARSSAARKVAETLHAGRPMRTAIGEIAFDARGDLAKPPYQIAVWRKLPDGRIDCAAPEPAR